MKQSTYKKPSPRALAERIEHHMKYTLCKRMEEASKEHLFTALALAVRDVCVDQMFSTASRHESCHPKRVYYLSLEYLIGRMLTDTLKNFGIYDELDQIKLNTKIALKDVLDEEYDPALGNGGLGRLAACFLDSMATLGYPAYGYGINYQFGLFRQRFENGYQKESADAWLDRSSPWLIERSDRACYVPVGGRIHYEEKDGKRYPHWVDVDHIMGVPNDMPVVGYGGETVNYLRLFSAFSSTALDLQAFNAGGYIEAVENKIQMETISKVLYPSDSFEAGRKLRLMQQYFFVSCAVNDILRRFLEEYDDLHLLPEKVVIQLNDTHPTLAIAEMVRVLMDVHGLSFEEAFDITSRTMAYTNHTLLPEALEKWSVRLFEEQLPRHLLIINDINAWLLKQVQAYYPNDPSKRIAMSIFEEGNDKKIRMAYLAIAGSFSVNGVSAIHTDILKHQLVPDFYNMWPEKFNNKTNGVTPRRWLLSANMGLADLISSRIGDGWITDLQQLHQLESAVTDEGFLTQLWDVKAQNKRRLADFIAKTTGVLVNPDSIFDAQTKRIHEYKRQLLNALHIMHQYLSIVEDGVRLASPKTYIFAGKAAPEYTVAKLIIKLLNNIAMVVNNDKKVHDQLQVVFIPDYKVSVAEIIIPGTEVSEQISAAGYEASGTGNMKFMMNGALTVGTLDGANVEIRQVVGEENFYLFGLTASEVFDRHKNGTHKPWDYYNGNPAIKRVMDALTSSLFSEDPNLFTPLFQKIMFDDFYMVLADFDAYVKIHEQIEKDYQDKMSWSRKSLMNIASSGVFSSDRTVKEYADQIWHIESTLK
ncbi:MAG: glycogen/starch/alpha-glucan phosphorylase [Alphaproteobacteria bacterium]|nr:glycogen/starch/alpha-glucan phosphorylase [Alphaproteobacteria bacterium]